MRLHLSESSHLFADYSNELGETIYHVQTNSRFWPRTTKISTEVPHTWSMGTASLARIDFRKIGSSKITIGGQEFDASKFFRKAGMGWNGRDRIFTGPDGREYRWLLGHKTSKLILNDGTQTEVANFHAKSFSLVHSPKNTYLEIMPIGEHMVDTILITFLYVEKLRKDSANSASGGGG